MEGNDMITNLYRLPKLEDRKDTIQIKRAFAGDKGAILNFIKSNFSDSWVYEAEHAIMQEVPKCFIAVEDKRLLALHATIHQRRAFSDLLVCIPIIVEKMLVSPFY